MQKLFPKMTREIQHISGKGFPSVKYFPFGKGFLGENHFPVWKYFQVRWLNHLGGITQLGSIFHGQQYGETLPRGIKTRKLFQKAIFWNSVKYSPLHRGQLQEVPFTTQPLILIHRNSMIFLVKQITKQEEPHKLGLGSKILHRKISETIDQRGGQ
jgi:hypothetical protein